MMNRYTMVVSRLLAGLALAVLASCGGGGDGGSGGSISGALSVACSGAQCGAADAQTYRGSGVGVWRYDNSASGATASVPIALGGVSGRTVTLVFTNVSDNDVTMPAISASVVEPPSSATQQKPGDVMRMPGVNVIPPHIRDYQPPIERASQAPRQDRVVAAVSAAAEGDTREWLDADGRSFLATLARRWAATDGRMLNIWVQDGERGDAKISDALLDSMQAKFSSNQNSIYPIVTDLVGAPWGETVGGGFIGPDQDLHIVLANLTPDRAPWGLVGYFFSANAFLKTYEPLSNEAVALFLDTETLYLGGALGRNTGYTTLAHEMTHMVNFYQRAARIGARPDYRFAVWLEETSALMMEDLLAERVIPGFNPLRDSDFANWLRQSQNCDYIRAWEPSPGASCFSYPIAANFGGYLLRHYGIGFYRDLVRSTSSTDSFTLLDQAIKRAGGAGVRAALRDWGAALALLPATSPSGFGYPRREEDGYVLPAVNGPDYASSRNLPARAPSVLKASGHFPVVRRPSGATYSETVAVPPRSALTVVVQ